MSVRVLVVLLALTACVTASPRRSRGRGEVSDSESDSSSEFTESLGPARETSDVEVPVGLTPIDASVETERSRHGKRRAADEPSSGEITDPFTESDSESSEDVEIEQPARSLPNQNFGHPHSVHHPSAGPQDQQSAYLSYLAHTNPASFIDIETQKALRGPAQYLGGNGFGAPGGSFGFPGMGNSFGPVGSSFSPLGNSFAPMGNSFAPMGNSFAPMGNSFAPMGNSFAPMGNSFAPMGNSFAPMGNSFAPMGNSFAPMGNSFAPMGNSFAPMGGSFGPALGALSTLGFGPAPAGVAFPFGPSF